MARGRMLPARRVREYDEDAEFVVRRPFGQLKAGDDVPKHKFGTRQLKDKFMRGVIEKKPEQLYRKVGDGFEPIDMSTVTVGEPGSSSGGIGKKQRWRPQFGIIPDARGNVHLPDNPDGAKPVPSQIAPAAAPVPAAAAPAGAPAGTAAPGSTDATAEPVGEKVKATTTAKARAIEIVSVGGNRYRVDVDGKSVFGPVSRKACEAYVRELEAEDAAPPADTVNS